MAKKTGRPKIEIDWENFEKLCGLQCTEEEIADFFGCSVDTITRRVSEKYKTSFEEMFRRWKGMGRVSLRRLQWQAAKGGSVKMLIWLGKQYLNQKDRIETSGLEERGPIVIIRSEEEHKKLLEHRAQDRARQQGTTEDITPE